MGGNIIEFEALRIKREGILEGKREGNHEALSQVALDMMNEGLPGDLIMKIARKSRKEIDELAKSNGFAVDWEEKTAAN